MLLLSACAHLPPAPAAHGAAADLAAAPTLGVAAPPPARPLDENGLVAILANPDVAPVVVNFWATWCEPCVAELGTLHEAAAAHPGVRFLLVSVDAPQDRAHVDAFVRDHDVRLPVLHLAIPDVTAALRRRVDGWPDSIPYTLVVEPGGAVRARFDGLVAPEELDAALQATPR